MAYRQRPGTLPCVYVRLSDVVIGKEPVDSASHLTAAEARQLAANLTAAADARERPSETTPPDFGRHLLGWRADCGCRRCDRSSPRRLQESSNTAAPHSGWINTSKTKVESMLMLVLSSLLVLATLTNVVLAPIEARKIRDGRNVRSFLYLWPSRRNLDLPHEEFLARYRRGLKLTGWPWVVIGVFMLTVTLVLFAWSEPWPSVWGCFFLLTGLTSVRCRRILDFPRAAPICSIPRDEVAK